MPIIHVHSPNKIIPTSLKRLQSHDWVLDAFREEQAQATIYGPGLLADVTPSLLKAGKYIPRDTTTWLHVDEAGENGRVIYHANKNLPNPKLLGYGNDEQLAAIFTDYAGAYRIGPEYTKQICLTGERGRGLAYQVMLGAIVLYRAAEEVTAFVQSFPEAPLQP